MNNFAAASLSEPTGCFTGLYDFTILGANIFLLNGLAAGHCLASCFGFSLTGVGLYY